MEDKLPDLKQAENLGWLDMQRRLDEQMPVRNNTRRRRFIYWSLAACVLLFLGTLLWQTGPAATEFSADRDGPENSSLSPRTSERTATTPETATLPTDKEESINSTDHSEISQSDANPFLPKNSSNNKVPSDNALGPIFPPSAPLEVKNSEIGKSLDKTIPLASVDLENRTKNLGIETLYESETSPNERIALTDISLNPSELRPIAASSEEQALSAYLQDDLNEVRKPPVQAHHFLAATAIHGPSASIGGTLAIGKGWSRAGSRWSVEAALGYRYHETYRSNDSPERSGNSLADLTYYVNQAELSNMAAASSIPGESTEPHAFLKNLHYATVSVGTNYRIDRRLSAYFGTELSGLLTVRRADDSFGGGLLAFEGSNQDFEIVNVPADQQLNERALRSFDIAVGSGLKLQLGSRLALTGRYHLGLRDLFMEKGRSLRNHRVEIGVRYYY